MSAEEEASFTELLAVDEAERRNRADQVAKKLREADEYEVTKLY